MVHGMRKFGQWIILKVLGRDISNFWIYLPAEIELSMETLDLE